MTRCATCGHDNLRDDLCEVCRRPLQFAAPAPLVGLNAPPLNMQPPIAGPEQTLQMAPGIQTTRRVSLTGEVVETTQAMPVHAQPGGAPGVDPGYRAPAYAGHPDGAEMILPASAYSAAAIREQ